MSGQRARSDKESKVQFDLRKELKEKNNRITEMEKELEEKSQEIDRQEEAIVEHLWDDEEHRKKIADLEQQLKAATTNGAAPSTEEATSASRQAESVQTVEGIGAANAAPTLQPAGDSQEALTGADAESATPAEHDSIIAEIQTENSQGGSDSGFANAVPASLPVVDGQAALAGTDASGAVQSFLRGSGGDQSAFQSESTGPKKKNRRSTKGKKRGKVNRSSGKTNAESE